MQTKIDQLTRSDIQAATENQLLAWLAFLMDEKHYKPPWRKQLCWIQFELKDGLRQRTKEPTWQPI